MQYCICIANHGSMSYKIIWYWCIVSPKQTTTMSQQHWFIPKKHVKFPVISIGPSLVSDQSTWAPPFYHTKPRTTTCDWLPLIVPSRIIFTHIVAASQPVEGWSSRSLSNMQCDKLSIYCPRVVILLKSRRRQINGHPMDWTLAVMAAGENDWHQITFSRN